MSSKFRYKVVAKGSGGEYTIGTVDENTSEYWFLGISPEGIGVIGMIINFLVAIFISSITKPPPVEVYEIVDNIRMPEGDK